MSKIVPFRFETRVFYRIRYLIALKSSILDFYSHKCLKIKVHSDYDLPLEKTLHKHDAVILVESFFNISDNLYNGQVF